MTSSEIIPDKTSTPPPRSLRTAAAPALAVKVWHSYAEAELVWRRFEAEGASYLNQTYTWCATWQETVGSALGVRPRLVAVTDSRGRVAMVLPFSLRRHHGLGFLDFPDGWIADYNAPLVAPDFAASLDAAAFQRLWQAVLTALPEADVVTFHKMPETVHGLPNPLLHLPCWRREESSHHAVLDGDFKAFMQRRSANLRNDIRRKRRRLQEKGPVQFRTAGTPEETAAFMAALIRQKSRRCQEMGVRDLFASPAYRDFFTAMAERHRRSGLVHLSALLVGDTIVATHLGMVHKDRYYWLVPGFEGGDWQPFSTGRLLLEHVVEWAHARGLAVFDMTVGDEGYKRQWCDHSMALYDCIAPVSRKGRLLYGPVLGIKRAVKSNPQLHRTALTLRRTVQAWLERSMHCTVGLNLVEMLA